MNKCKGPKFPPILSDKKFITNYKDKTNAFAKFYSLQCKPMIHDCLLTYLTTSWLENIVISADEIISLTCNLNKGKVNRPDDISVHMLIL